MPLLLRLLAWASSPLARLVPGARRAPARDSDSDPPPAPVVKRLPCLGQSQLRLLRGRTAAKKPELLFIKLFRDSGAAWAQQRRNRTFSLCGLRRQPLDDAKTASGPPAGSVGRQVCTLCGLAPLSSYWQPTARPIGFPPSFSLCGGPLHEAPRSDERAIWNTQRLACCNYTNGHGDYTTR